MLPFDYLFMMYIQTLANSIKILDFKIYKIYKRCTNFRKFTIRQKNIQNSKFRKKK